MKTLTSIAVISLFSTALWSLPACADVPKKQQQVKEKQGELAQERSKESAALAAASNKSMQQVSRASKIIGAHVTNAKGENLGDIKELVLDPQTGQVVYAVVSFGGLLGVGDKLFALPWQALHWTGDKGYYALNEEKSTLTNAPGFDKKHWPDSSSRWDQLREETNQFYHVKP
jgi:sporulation protein YlmC with PRC-barrel domain